MNEMRDSAARIAYEAEVENYGGYDWDTAKNDVGKEVGPAPQDDELGMAYEIADKIIALVRADERKRIRERSKDAMVMEEVAYAMFSVPEKDDSDTDPCGDYFRRMADKAVEVFLNPIIYQLTTGG